MKLGPLTPTRLRLILVAAMVAIVIIGVALFTLGYQKIKEYSVASQTVAAQAQASNSSVQNLISIKKQLEKNTEAIQRASMIVSESKTYTYADKVVQDNYSYQDQIIKDIGSFAGNAGVVITNISFSDVGTNGAVTPAPAAAAAAPSGAPAAGGPAAGTTSAIPAGIKTTTATVTVKNPVDYNNMLKFIHSIEENLFTMRISQVSLSKPTDASRSPNEITSDVFTIEVYLR